MNKYRNIFFILVFLLITLSCKNHYQTNHQTINYWENSFDYTSVKESIQSKKLKTQYSKAFPVKDFWTYATIQPTGANIEIINDNDISYLKCSVPPANDTLTSKAQICRKFPPP